MNKFSSVQVLRALAALMVVVLHSKIMFSPEERGEPTYGFCIIDNSYLFFGAGKVANFLRDCNWLFPSILGHLS